MFNTAISLKSSGVDRTALARTNYVAARALGQRNYNALYNGDKIAVVTKGQMKKIDSAITHQGRMNAIQRAANGGSAG